MWSIRYDRTTTLGDFILLAPFDPQLHPFEGLPKALVERYEQSGATESSSLGS